MTVHSEANVHVNVCVFICHRVKPVSRSKDYAQALWASCCYRLRRISDRRSTILRKYFPIVHLLYGLGDRISSQTNSLTYRSIDLQQGLGQKNMPVVPRYRISNQCTQSQDAVLYSCQQSSRQTMPAVTCSWSWSRTNPRHPGIDVNRI